MFPALLSFLRNFPLGAFLGAILGIGFMLVIESELSDEYTKFATYGISALVALLGSGLAVAGVLANIENQNTLADEERRRALSAERAMLPLTLSQLCEVARHGMLHRWNGHTRFKAIGGEIYRSQSTNDLSLTTEMTDNLQEFVRFSRESDGEVISVILREYQVLFARWKGCFDEEGYFDDEDERERIHHTASWAFLYALATAGFNYARGDTEAISHPDDIYDNIGNALRNARILSPISPLVAKFENDVDLFQKKFDALFRRLGLSTK